MSRPSCSSCVATVFHLIFSRCLLRGPRPPPPPSPNIQHPAPQRDSSDDGPTPYQLEKREKLASFESLLASIRQNKITNLRLSLDVESDVQRLLEAITVTSNSSENTSSIIEEVNVDIYETFQQRKQSSQEILDLFIALGTSLPKLQRLWIDSGTLREVGSPFYPLPVVALTQIILMTTTTTTNKLQKVALYDVELVASTLEEWTAFENAFSGSSSLQAFGLVGCRLAEETKQLLLLDQHHQQQQQQDNIDDPTCYALSKLVGTSLANLPTIEWVELMGQEYDALGELTPQSLESLCHSISLTKLTLDYFDLNDDHIIAMSKAFLQTSTTSSIEEWKITCDLLGRRGCSALAQLLLVNTSLKNFCLQLNELIIKDGDDNNDNSDNDNGGEGDDYADDDEAAVAVPQLFEQHNNNNNNISSSTQEYLIKKRPANNNNNNKNDPMFAVAQALERNQSLQYFCLFGYAKITQATQEAFATLLRSNTTLLTCDIDLQQSPNLSHDLQRQVDLLLRLNELGRKKLLLGQATSYEWVMTLREVRDDLDALFYLLSVNPTLCDIYAAGTANQEPALRTS